jgi:predicted Zn-dependent protease with MMP-like domain
LREDPDKAIKLLQPSHGQVHNVEERGTHGRERAGAAKATAKKMAMMTTKKTTATRRVSVPYSLPQEFRSRIRNVAVLVEDFPPNQPSPQPGQQRRLLLGLFHGVPTTKKSIFDLPTGPDHIVLYQKNIEAVCSSEAEVRDQIRLTVFHELGHYFGMDENQLKDV